MPNFVPAVYARLGEVIIIKMWGQNDLGAKHPVGGEPTCGETTGGRFWGETSRGGNGLGSKRFGLPENNSCGLQGPVLFFWKWPADGL